MLNELESLYQIVEHLFAVVGVIKTRMPDALQVLPAALASYTQISFRLYRSRRAHLPHIPLCVEGVKK